MIDYADFARIDVRAGTIRAAEPLEGARNPALKLLIDFGPPKRIAGFASPQVAVPDGARLY